MIRPFLALACCACLAAVEVALSPAIGHRQPAFGILPLEDGTVLTCDGSLRLWDVAAKRLLWLHQGEPIAHGEAYGHPPPPALAVADERLLVAWGRTIAAVDRRSGRQLVRREVPRGVTWLGFSRDGRWAFAGDNGGVVCHAVDGTATQVHPVDGTGRVIVASSGTTPQWMAQAADGERAWFGPSRSAKGEVIELQRQGDGWRRSAVLATALPDGRTMAGCLVHRRDGTPVLVTAHAAGQIRVWPLPLAPGARPLASFALDRKLSLASERLVPAGPGQAVLVEAGEGFNRHRLLDVEAGTAQEFLPKARSVAALVPAGGQVWYARLKPATVALVDAATMHEEAILPAATDSLAQAMARDASGRWLCVATAHGIQRWDLALLRLAGWLPLGEGAQLLDLGAGIAAVERPIRRFASWSERRWHLFDPAGAGWPGGIEAVGPPVVLGGTHLAVPEPDGVRIIAIATRAVAAVLDLPAPGNARQFVAVTPSLDGKRLSIIRSGVEEFEHHDATRQTPATWRALVVEQGTWKRIGGGDAVDGKPVYLHNRPGVVAASDGWRIADARRRLSPEGTWEKLGAEPAPAPAQAPAAATVPSGQAWYARLVAAIGSHGEAMVRAPDGAAVHLLADAAGWAVWDDAGRFDGDRSADRLLVAITAGRRAALDEVAPWSNRPDHLLRTLGCDDADLLAAAAAPAERRRRVAVERRPQVALRTPRLADGVLHLEAEASAPGALARIEAWINGVPLPPLPAAGRTAVVPFAVPLGPGENTIEVAAVDAEGARSLRALRPGPARPAGGGLVAACLGVSRYRDPELALRYAAKDAVDLGLALADAPGGARVQVHTDREVEPGLLLGLRSHFAAAAIDDVAILYLRTPAPVYHYLPWAADRADLAASAIPWPAILAVFDGCPARRRLVILDTCESGALEDEPGAGADGLVVAGARGLRRMAAVAEAGSALAREFRATDRQRYLTADLDRAGGVVVLASARGGEPSFESEPDANGLFTQCLLDALRQAPAEGRTEQSTEELVRRLAEAVAARTAGRQRPTIDRDNALAGIRLPVLPPAE